MMDRSEVVLRVTPDSKLAEEWALVLITQGLSPSLHHDQRGMVLSIPAEEAEMALAGLAAYENENPVPVPKEQNRSDDLPNSVAGLVVAGVLILSHAGTVRWKEAVPWIERGSAEASRILDGELWRTVTALTLHADLVHLISNAVAAAIFVTALSSIVGAGLAFTLLVISGACGNLVNSLVQGSSHIAVGASTAIFGAVGVLGSQGLIRRRRDPTRRRGAWIPIAASLGLLAMLGTGTGRTDVLAHLFGFFCGAALGIPVGLFFPVRPGLLVQWLFGSATAAVLIYCWTLALD
ncbi:MAG TPA: rhomboid family intramembrane serine protease [Candidatus Binatia bacterium]